MRRGDLGTVMDGAEDIREGAWLQDKRAIIIDVHKQPGFNVVDTIQQIKDQLPTLAASLPPTAQLHTVGDRTQTIQAPLNDAQLTMMITIALVVMGIFSFLRNLLATVIPAETLPQLLAA